MTSKTSREQTRRSHDRSMLIVPTAQLHDGTSDGSSRLCCWETLASLNDPSDYCSCKHRWLLSLDDGVGKQQCGKTIVQTYEVAKEVSNDAFGKRTPGQCSSHQHALPHAQRPHLVSAQVILITYTTTRSATSPGVRFPNKDGG